MNVVLVTSVSQNIACYADLTVPNKYRYCMRHGYSLVVDNRPYEEAVAGVAWMTALFERFDLVWCLDADAVITNMSVPIHTLDCLGPHMTVCEEGICDWNLLNCGSFVMRATRPMASLLVRISGSVDEWKGLPCGWQSWLADHRDGLGDTLTVAPLRAFNSCAWNHTFGPGGKSGTFWQPGDLVFHANGVYPIEERTAMLRYAIDHFVEE